MQVEVETVTVPVPRGLAGPAPPQSDAKPRQELKGPVQPHHQAAADISMEMRRFGD